MWPLRYRFSKPINKAHHESNESLLIDHVQPRNSATSLQHYCNNPFPCVLQSSTVSMGRVKTAMYLFLCRCLFVLLVFTCHRAPSPGRCKTQKRFTKHTVYCGKWTESINGLQHAETLPLKYNFVRSTGATLGLFCYSHTLKRCHWQSWLINDHFVQLLNSCAGF